MIIKLIFFLNKIYFIFSLIFKNIDLKSQAFTSNFYYFCFHKFLFYKILSKLKLNEFIYFFCFIFFTNYCTANSQKITIVWSTENSLSNVPNLVDLAGNSLTSGIQGNGDGDLVELGYYNAATTSSPFSGIWVPLTQNTRIGDSSTGYGFDHGKFAFTSTFTKDSNSVTIFPTEPKVYVETLDFTITSSTPPTNIPLCIRFYDSKTKDVNAKYNAVTGPNWKWPSFPHGSSIPSNLYFKISDATPPAGSFWKYGSTFEDSLNPFVASKSQSFSVGISLSPSSPSEMGAVLDINNTYAAGSYLDVNATALPNHEFYMWEGGTFTDPYAPNTQVFVDGNLEIRALFYPEIYYIDIPTSQIDLVQGWGPFDYNSQASVFANAPEGYKFSHWEKNSEIVSIDNPHEFTVVEDVNLSANYTPLDYNVSLTAGDGGVVVNVLDQFEDNATNFYYDSNYTVTIRPDRYYKFKEWNSNSQTNNIPIALTDDLETWYFSPDANTSYIAEFELIENYLDIKKGVGAESVYPQSNMFDAILGEISIGATALDGYEFSHWSDPFGLISDLNESATDLNVSKIDGFAEITANFRLITYTLSDINISASIGGNYILENPESGNFQHFGQYSLLAVPNVGYKFDRWSGDQNATNLSDSPTLINNFLIINGPIQLEALFVPTEYELSTTSTPTDGGFVSGGGGFSILDSLSVQAEPSPYWYFDQWSGDVAYLTSPNSATSSIEWPYNTEPRDLNLTAHFKRQSLTVEATHSGSGTLSFWVKQNDNTYQSGTDLSEISTSIQFEDQVLIDAVADDGWAFNHWAGLPQANDLWDYNIVDPYIEVVDITPTSDIALTANFTRKKYDLLISDLTQGGSSSGGGNYEFEQLVEISATANPQFIFSGWSGSDAHYLQSPPSFPENSLTIPNHDLQIFASFHPIVYSITTSSGENGSISLQSTFGEFIHSENEINATSRVEIIVEPDPGYVLQSLNWEKSDGTFGISYANIFTIPELDGNYSLHSTFKVPPNSLNYSISSSINGAGTVQELTVLATQSQRTFQATSFDEYSFLGWTTDLPSQIYPHWSSSSIDINLTDGTAIHANFSENPKILDLEFNSDFGNIDLNQSDTNNNNYSLHAHPAENYVFESWEIDKNFSYELELGFSSIQQGFTRLFIDGKESPELTLIRGFTYHFKTDLGADDELFFSEYYDDSIINSYSTGVSDNNGTIVFQIPEDCPDTLFYSSKGHSYAGNRIKIISFDENEFIPYPQNTNINLNLPCSLRVKAKFAPIELNLNKITSGNGVISTNLDRYFYGSEVNVRAVPELHWEFSHWDGDVEIPEPNNPEITIQLLKDSQLLANFNKIPYSLTVVSSPIDFGDSQTKNNVYTYYHGDTVHIEAIPKQGKYFSHWSSPVLSNRQFISDTSFIFDEDAVLTAFFESNEYNMSYNVFVTDHNNNILRSDFGGFIAAKSTYDDGDEAIFKFILNDGYDFVSWRNADNNSTITNDISFTQTIKEGLNLNVLLKKKEHLVSIITTPEDQGIITINQNDYNGTISLSVSHGDELNILATPKEGYTFQKWVSFGGLLAFPNKRSLNLTIEDDIQIAGYFSPLDDVELNIVIEPADAGWASGAGSFSYNSEHSITATPLRGWTFDRWIGNGIANESLRTTHINLDGNKTIIAQFIEDPDDGGSSGNNSSLYVLLVSSQNAEFGSVSGTGIYNENWIDISASPHDGYDFSHWEGEYIENEFSYNTRTYVNTNKQILANFVKSSLLETSSNIQDQWWSNGWLGNYWKQTNSNWIFHEKLGWSFVRLENEESIWVWIDKLKDWFWTNSEVYPYLNSTNLGWIWVKLEKSSTKQLYFYKYSDPEGWLVY